jgi:hypothetical protein
VPTPRTSAGVDGGADCCTPRDGRLRATPAAAAGAERSAVTLAGSSGSSSAVSPRSSSSR